MVFRNSKGQILDPLSYTLQIINNYPDVEIHIGTDSYSESDNTRYITAIAYRYKEAGVHYIYSKFNVPKINDIWTRLWKETEKSILNPTDKLQPQLPITFRNSFSFNFIQYLYHAKSSF